MKRYFQKVNDAQNYFFYDHRFLKLKKNCKLLSLQMGDINNIKLKEYKIFFQSDLYIVFGTSFIKGKILKFLTKNKAINLHMGLSPYYRGTDCNFWAVYDKKIDKVGATTHLLSNVLDGGKILYLTKTLKQKNSFKLTMSAVKLAVDTLIKKIKSKEILKLKPIKQDKSLEIRYSRKRDFTDKIVKNFMKKKIMKKKIIFFSGKRGGINHLIPIFNKLKNKKHYDLKFIFSDMHLSKKFGNTISEYLFLKKK